MRTAIIALALAMTVFGCRGGETRGSGDTTIRSADTNVSDREVRDTAIVRSDTTVRTDTVHKMGTDTGKKKTP